MKQVVHSRTAWKGTLFEVEEMELSDQSGSRIRREVVRHPGAVLIIPVLDCDRLVMIRNERDAVEKTLWEFPAGKLESAEPPSDAAARELEEETGYRSENLTLLGRFYTSPGLADEIMHAYIATDLTPVHRKPEIDERIEVIIVSLAEVDKLIAGGELCDGKSLAALMLWRTRAGLRLADGSALNADSPR